MNRRGFTLVEILVTISIISLLMAIALPALNKARGLAKGVYCQNNLRQMAIASQSYTQTYDKYYPIAQYSKIKPEVKYFYCWDFTTITKPDTQEIVPGLLWQGYTVEKVQQCPAFEGASMTVSDPYTGYNYNTSYIGHGQYETISKPAKISEVINPANCALFGDGQWSGGANKFMRSPFPSPADKTFSWRYSGTQGFRHNNKTNVVWADGHTSSEAKRYTNTLEQCVPMIVEGTGFLSQDNRAYDLRN